MRLFFNSLQPLKQHITEEKMAEHMSKLHISSETASSKETETGRIQRLYMCEEMRKLQSDSIIPHSLIAQIQQPCKALVLWKPPSRIIPPCKYNGCVRIRCASLHFLHKDGKYNVSPTLS